MVADVVYQQHSAQQSMPPHLAHDGHLLQELLVLACIILQLLQDLDCHLLPTVVAPVQIAEAASSNLETESRSGMRGGQNGWLARARVGKCERCALQNFLVMSACRATGVVKVTSCCTMYYCGTERPPKTVGPVKQTGASSSACWANSHLAVNV
jgi:hypothetical protein